MEFHVRYNSMDINSLTGFTSVKGGMSQWRKDVYFLRFLGVNASLEQEVEQMDRILSEQMLLGRGTYNRSSGLPRLADRESVDYYSNCYETWIKSHEKEMQIHSTEKNGELGVVLAQACKLVLDLYGSSNAGISSSMKKNFAVKLLYWFDQVAAVVAENWNPRNSMKFVMSNVSNKQEYLFAYLLTLVGIDVLLLQCSKDIDDSLKNYNWSKEVFLGQYQNLQLPPYQRSRYQVQKEKLLKREIQPKPQENRKVSLRNQEREAMQQKKQNEKKKMERQDEYHGAGRESGRWAHSTVALGQMQEKSMEELAALAASVVMIAIHGADGNIIGTGSGIMVGQNGYILTNNHVASGGRFFSVRIEEDDRVYQTNEVIKYNPIFDLALIRIQRKLQPLPIYKGGEKLRRGQKVVAIGSPMGLFNTVSDGIISGFRNFDGVEMIQFTAPTSHGSSGGALLNMKGEVIGISSSGVDEGENLNFAVGYENILNFARGII